jgi:ABC-type cobalamin transport system permease subunit
MPIQSTSPAVTQGCFVFLHFLRGDSKMNRRFAKFTSFLLLFVMLLSMLPAEIWLISPHHPLQASPSLTLTATG